jgi:hypothetical protein
MATTDDLVLLDRAVSNYHKAELFPAAHARQLKGLGSYGEDLSRRDSMKVAQYEVLGNEAKGKSVP